MKHLAVLLVTAFFLSSCLTNNGDREVSSLYPAQLLQGKSTLNAYRGGDTILKNGEKYYVQEDPSRGYYWPFIIEIPANFEVKEENRILVISNNTTFRTDDFNEHIERAGGASWLPYIQLIPVFPRFEKPEMREGLSPQYLSAGCFTTRRLEEYRIDLQLIHMIARATQILSENGIRSHEKCFIWGFSASGFFASKFIILHPEIVEAASFGGHYWTVIPAPQYENLYLGYNYGIHGIEKLTGIVFDEKSFRQIKQFVYMGQNDNPIGPIHYSTDVARERESSSYIKAFEKKFGNTTEKLFHSYKKAYQSLGYSNVNFRLYMNADHLSTYGRAKNDVLNFFASIDE